MKTIEEIKNDVAIKHGYSDWNTLICEMLHIGWRMTAFLKYENEAMQEHAKQCCDMQIEECQESILQSISNITYRAKAHKAVKNTPNVA